jgi:hypothetical protein
VHTDGPELCDDIDNDCNGQNNETFDLQNDVNNCGSCNNVCRLANAVAKCVNGKCEIQSCSGGFIDKDGDDQNGCEEPCVVSNNGVEICDGKDNDCNGVVDDPGGTPIDFNTDPLNCGGCNVPCVRANANTQCVAGKCTVKSCKGTFVDADKDDGNGCECKATGSETCDGVDNDCNGKVDDGLPPLGACGTNQGECSQGTLVCINGVAVCQNAVGPTIEVCDGKDNDCDGTPDNNLPASLGLCGNDKGECQPGNLVCQNGAPTCVGAVGPKTEVCDGRDNDCNGVPDDGLPSNLGACGSARGECKQGQLQCQGGIEVCVGAIGPQPEVCDGKDNDCNGTPDDKLPPSLGSCGSSVGQCQLGTLVCQNGKPTCTGDVGPTTEVCDGLDNDCNGTPDDGLPANLGPCGSSQGECKQGHLECSGGVEVCVGATGPQPEICDGKDNDCNGTPDDNLPSSLGICGSDVGDCQPGTLVCQNGAPTCMGRVLGTTEVCDGRDNDCDGTPDNNIPGYPGSCGSDVGECVAGVLTCQNGTDVCTGAVGPQRENCDGLDNDCNNQLDPPTCVFASAGRERRIDDLSETGLGANNSTQLSIAGRGQRVLAAWLDRRGTDRADIWANLSTDGGVTWQAADYRIADESQHKVEPQVAFGGPTASSVRAYLVYGRFTSSGTRQAYIRRSTDGAATFGTEQRLDSGSNDSLFFKLAVRPGATSSAPDTVVVCWETIQTVGATAPNIYCRLSADSGVTWTAERQVNNTANNAISPQLVIGNTNAYVSWQQGTSIRVAWAPLDAATFDFTGHETTLSGTHAGRLPKIATDKNGTVVVVWEDLRDPLINVRANRSTDSGATWLSDGVRVDLDVVDGDSREPTVAMQKRAGGRAFVAWTDTSRGQPDIYVNASDDGGATWGIVARRVNANTAGTAESGAPVLAVADNVNNAYVAWEDQRNGASRDIYFGLSIDNGDNWNVPDYRLNESSPGGTADARSPLMWVSPGAGSTPGRVAIIWIDNRAAGSGSTHITGSNADIYSTYVQ